METATSHAPGLKASLVKIANENGGLLRPKDVVEAARPIDSPLHSRFTWDDTEAAEKWRLHEAGKLIRIVVESMEYTGKAVETRVFVSLPSDRKEDRGYRLTASVLSDKQYRKELLASALHDLRSFEAKYSTLRELASVMRPIKSLLKAKQQTSPAK